jgi:hypothetical protein
LLFKLYFNPGIQKEIQKEATASEIPLKYFSNSFSQNIYKLNNYENRGLKDRGSI